MAISYFLHNKNHMDFYNRELAIRFPLSLQFSTRHNLDVALFIWKERDTINIIILSQNNNKLFFIWKMKINIIRKKINNIRLKYKELNNNIINIWLGLFNIIIYIDILITILIKFDTSEVS